MAKPRIMILRAPGTNCDAETAHAFERVGGIANVFHLNRLLEAPGIATDFQIICIPGGFAHGDDIAAGKIFANQIRHHLADTMREFREAGNLILGICNGFQVLIKSGLLDTDDAQGPNATLTWNDSGLFMDRWVNLQTVGNRCVFLQGIDRLSLRVTHAEGKFVVRDQTALTRFENNSQLVLRYSPSNELPTPYNPNGAFADVAGMCDTTGRVFGMMPHPESYIDFTQHPQWTRRPRPSDGDGLAVFRNAVKFFQ